MTTALTAAPIPPQDQPLVGRRGRRVALAGAAAFSLVLGLAPGLVTTAAEAAPAPTNLTLRASTRTALSGAKIGLAAHLALPKRTLSFTETIPGRAAVTIYQGTTDARGNLVISGPVSYNATFTVRYAGDSTHAAASARVGVSVRARAGVKLGGGSKRKGYRLYGAKKRVSVTAAVAPAKAGQRVLLRLQTKRKGHWRTVDTRSYRLPRNSAFRTTFRGKAGHRYRVRVEYRGDALNARNASAWGYATFRR